MCTYIQQHMRCVSTLRNMGVAVKSPAHQVANCIEGVQARFTTLGGLLWACNATSLQDLQQMVHKRGLANVRTQSATVHAAAATSTPSTPVVAKDPERERLVSAVETLSRQVQRLELQQQQQQRQLNTTATVHHPAAAYL